MTSCAARQQAVTIDRTGDSPIASEFGGKLPETAIIIRIANHHERPVGMIACCSDQVIHQQTTDAATLQVGPDGNRADHYQRCDSATGRGVGDRPALQAAQQICAGTGGKAERRNRQGTGAQPVRGAAKTIHPECGVEQRFDCIGRHCGQGIYLDQRSSLHYGERPLGADAELVDHRPPHAACPMTRKEPTLIDSDSLILEVHDLEVDVLTGVYSEETHLPQPLRISLVAELAVRDHYAPETPLGASKSYMDLKWAATDGLPKDVHFTLIEAVADHIAGTIFLQDDKVRAVTITIVKLAIAEAGERIGITLRRQRP